jgi:glycosyltransferase involved in cell wall biosynthesis
VVGGAEFKLNLLDKVSIIMTVFNGERFLREAIESILAQTYANLELIIIDDGSTDSSLAIINSFDDDRIVLLINESNKGQSYSRNRGIKESSGEYIAIMDADDIALPKRLEIQYEYLKSNTEISLCGSWIEVIGEEGDFKKIRKVPTENFEIKADLIFNCPIIHPTVMFVKKDFVENGFFYDEKFKYAQDMELWSRAMFKLNFGNIPEPLLKMRFGNSLSISFKYRTEQQYFGGVIVNNTLNRLGIIEKWDFTNSFYYKTLIYKRILKSENLKVPTKVLKNKLGSYFPKRIEKLIFSLVCFV